MTALRILVLCISAALICASVRTMHPQIASAIALAAGVAAILSSVEDIEAFSDILRNLSFYVDGAERDQLYLLKICGIAIVAEFASDICRDSGESALAHRIDAAVKIGVVASALPAAGRIMEGIAELMK